MINWDPLQISRILSLSSSISALFLSNQTLTSISSMPGVLPVSPWRTSSQGGGSLHQGQEALPRQTSLGNHRAHLISLPSLRGHCPLLIDVQCLEWFHIHFVHSLFVSNGKVNLVTVISYWLKAEVFQ